MLTPVFIDFSIMLPYVAETVKMSLFAYKDPCLVLGAPAPQLVAVLSARFMRALMYLHWFQLPRELVLAVLDNIPHFRYYYDVTLKLETYITLGIVFMC